MTVSRTLRSTWLWAALGLVGSLLIAYASPRAVPDPAVHWWYVPAVPAGRGVSLGLVYAGMAALSAGWLGLGRALPSRRGLLLIAAAWALPLALAPPLFSRDVYSYLAQGTILHLGHSPYHSAPEVLAGLGRPRVLDAVSPFWRGTTAPYGPLFLGLVSLIVGGVGSRLVAGVLLIRLVELIGVVLLASAVPRLTRALGTDTRRGLWLALLSPLMMLQLICAGHNDVLMVGLMAAGVASALAGRPLTGIALCALAATVKVPALAGVLFIAAAWARAETGRPQRTRFLLAAGAITIAVLGVVTALTGAGLDWLSTSLFSTPAKVRLAITPATAVGYTIASLLRDAGVATTGRGLEGALGLVATGLTALAGLVMLWRVRVVTMVASLGAFLLLAAAAGPALWPWYLEWGLALIAAVRWAQRSALLPAAIVVAAVVVKPNGILGLPRPTAPAVLAVYAAAGLAIWIGHRRRAIGGNRPPPASGAGSGDPAPAAMTSTASSALTGG